MNTPSESPSSAVLEQGLGHHKAGRLKEAEAAYRQVLEREPQNPDALHYLGLLAAQGGAPEDGIKLIEGALQLDPENAAAHSNLGNILCDSGRYDDAIAHHRKSAEIEPDQAVIYADLGRALLMKGETGDAVTALEKSVSLDSSNLQAYFYLSNAYHAEGRLDDAVKHYLSILEKEPRAAAVHNDLGNVYQDMGRSDDAVASYQKALELQPDFFAALNNLGVLHLERGEIDQALELYRRALEKTPNVPEIHLNLAIALRAAGNLDEAESRLRRAGELAPENAQIPFNLGIVYRDRGKTEEAIEAYERAIALDETMAQAHGNLGNLLEESGRADAAIEHFRAAIRIAPEAAPFYVNLGNALQARGDTEAAAEAYEKALALGKDPTTETMLRQLRARQLPRWHFPMMADDERNAAYRKAIEAAVGPGSRVLDIGTGSGLLAMMAARAGAARVVACEESAPLAAVAEDIVARNGLADRVKVVAKKSNNLVVGVDLDGPADVIVAEVFDFGLLREGALPTLRHAVNRLAAPGAAIIPRSASVKGLLAELPGLRRVNPVRDVAGFDLSAFDAFRNPYVNVPDLNREEHRRLSDVFVMAEYDFSALAPLGPARGEDETLQVPITESGTAQAVVYWFDLDLGNGVTLSSGPLAGCSHWGQAACFFDADVAVEKGETMPLTVTRGEMLITIAPA